MIKIKQIVAREILDSRGNPTIETKIFLSNGLSVKASVPSGASTGEHEAWELRDLVPSRYNGKGVLRAVRNVNNIIAPKLKGLDVTKQEKIDTLLLEIDGSENKKRLGANALLSVSMAVARAGALAKKKELYKYLSSSYGFRKMSLPTPSFNIFNGGAHASTNLDFQEFMILPLKKCSLAEKVRLGSEVFQALGKVLKERGLDTDLGNEGGYAPEVKSREEVIEMIVLAIKKANYQPKKDVALGFDIGASELYNPKTHKYELPLDNKKLSAKELREIYKTWIKKYPIVSIEDGLAENEWEDWREMTKELGKKTLLIGDDLFVTNKKRLEQGIKMGVANAILIKLNQIGTVSETMETIKLAQANGYKLMISHRSGETTDDFIADLAVACGAEYIKAGAPARGERVAKYNRLMEIEMDLKK